MDKKDLEDIYYIEQDYWWFVGRRKIIQNLIMKYLKGSEKSFTLDAGCGTGIFLKYLEEYFISVGVDSSKISLHYTKRRGCKNVICGDISNLPFKNESFDLITILGVLYHKEVKSDDKVIEESFRVLKKKGIMVIDEAAYNFLQSKHNLSVGGARRYTRKQLISKAKKGGFEILISSYWNMLMLPLFFLIVTLENQFFPKRQFSKLERIPKLFNYIMKSYLYVEAFFIKYISFPFGPSVVIVAKKK